MGYVKLFDKLIRSSIWDEDDGTRVVWITMLAMADKDGEVRTTDRFLAMAARVSEGQLDKSLGKLLRPDKRSTSKEYEGRRIEAIEGGWKILNYGKYRQMMRGEERREYQRNWQAEQREKGKAMNTGLKGAEKQAAIDALAGKTCGPGELEKELERIHGPYDAEEGMTEERRQRIMEKTRAKIERLEALEAAVRAKYNPEGTEQMEVREDEKGLSAAEMVKKRVEEDPIT